MIITRSRNITVGYVSIVILSLFPSPFFLNARTDEKTQAWLGTLHTDTGYTLPNAHLPLQRAEWVADLRVERSSFIYFLGQFVSYISMHCRCTHWCSDCTSTFLINRKILAMLSISQEKNNRIKILPRTLKLGTKTKQSMRASSFTAMKDTVLWFASPFLFTRDNPHVNNS